MVFASAAVTLLAVELTVRRMAPTLAQYNTCHYPGVAKGYRGAPHEEIALLGSSRARYALDPAVFEEILGRPAHNVAVSGAHVVEWTVFTRQIFSAAPPRLVVLGVNAKEVSADCLPLDAARQLFDFDDFLESVRIDGPSLDVAGSYARRSLGPVWKTFDARFELLNWGQERLACFFPKHAQLARELRERITGPRPPNGYDHPWRRGRRLKSLAQKVVEGPLAYTEESPPIYAPDSAPMRRFRKLLEWFERRGIRVIVAYLPNSPHAERLWRKTEPEIAAAVARVCREQGVPFLHWSRAQLPRTDRDFLDETHMGWPLAKEISRRIAERVRALALLDDSRSPEAPRIALTEERP